MKTTFSKKQVSLTVACALALSFVSGAVLAQSASDPADLRMIWQDSPKDALWKNPYGLCWRSAFGPPPAYGECNPAPVAQYVAPVVVAAPPAPAQAQYVAPAPAPVVVPPELPRKKDRN